MAILIKNQRQIEGIRKSCRLAAATLRYISQFVVAGVTTGELNDLCEKYIVDNNAIPAPLGYMGYPKATCISLNEVICHGIPGQEKLKDGDIVNIDVTTILDGYYGDTSTMFTVGAISEDAQHLLDVAKRCLDIGIKQVRPGNRFGNIGYEIHKYAMLQGCTVVYQFCGHGVGIRFHEEPQVSHIADKDSGPKMRPGMIFTIEPMINLGSPEAIIDEEDKWTARTVDGKLSAQYEHTVLVTSTGAEILTL
jgi:methionyl aminopeptidase